MKYKAIVFDFDGVLFDSERIHLHACNEAFHGLGFSISEEEYFQFYVGLPDQDMFKLIFDKRNIFHDTEIIKEYTYKKIIAYKDHVSLNSSLDGIPGVKKFIKSIANMINQFAICSASSYEEIHATLIRLENGELKHHFKHIISIDEVQDGKPSPEGYLLSARRLGISPKDCLAIEDTAVGISAAKSAGMTVIGITTNHERSALNQADFIAASYAEIENWLNPIS